MASKHSSQSWLSRKWHGTQCSSQSWLSRKWHGIKQYERIKKHDDEEEEISSEAEVTVTRKKVSRLFKLSRKRPRTRWSKRTRFVLGMGRRPRLATVFSKLKVSWRRFTKLVKDSQPQFADMLDGSPLLLHLSPFHPSATITLKY